MSSQQNQQNSNQPNFPGFPGPPGFLAPFTLAFHPPHTHQPTQQQTHVDGQSSNSNNSNNNNASQNQPSTSDNNNRNNNTNTNGVPLPDALHFLITVMPSPNDEGNNSPSTPFMIFFSPFFIPPQEVHNPPLSDAAMKKLPLVVITQEHINMKATCPICLEQFSLPEITKDQTQQPIREMPCKHIFCETCLFAWLKQNNTCPLCRYEITVNKKDDDQQSEDSS